MEDKLLLSAEVFKYWMVNNLDGTIRIIRQDGQVLEEALPAHQRTQDPKIACSIFDWEKWWVHSFTVRGDWIVTEGFNPHSPPPLNGRPAVYLDQNRWRTVADALLDPSSVSNESERRAALDLINLAQDGGIVLPLSMGHLIETAGLHGDLRYKVGVAMAKLAGGWQIRNPLDIWKFEAHQTAQHLLGIEPDEDLTGRAVTTEPGALFGSDSRLSLSANTPGRGIFMAMLIMPNVILDVLIEPERMPKNSLSTWVDHHRRVTAQIHREGLAKEQRRKLARRRYWNENLGFYTAAYRKLTRFEDFPTFSDSELRALLWRSPMVGLLSELFVQRFVDHMGTWSRNDLIDMFHLSSASAYAQYVAAEARTGSQLRSAQRALGREVNVFTTLDDLVTAVRRGGARTESETLATPSNPGLG